MPRAPRRVIPMAGVAVGLDASDERRWRAIDALFGRCREVGGAPVVSVSFDDARLDRPPSEPDVTFSDVAMWFTDDGVVTRHDSGLVIRRRGGAIRAAGPDTGADLPRAFRRSVQHVLVDALADHGRHALHAAAFARGEQAVVVLGDTGAGKSTLAVGALRAGWSVLTDDISWLTTAHDGLVVTGFPKPLHVPSDLRVEIPDAMAPILGDERGRYVLASGLTNDDVARRLVGVVEVRHGAGGGAVTPLPSGPRLMAMAMASYPLQAHAGRTRQFFAVAARVGRLPAVTIAHAADPSQRSARGAVLLEEAWHALGADGEPDQ